MPLEFSDFDDPALDKTSSPTQSDVERELVLATVAVATGRDCDRFE